MKQSINRKFLKFVLPSMFTMLLTGFYVIVDGLFVGRAVGDQGLAAINLAWPIAAVIIALGAGIGAGGSVVMSIKKGEGDRDGARRARAHTFLLLALATVICTTCFGLSYPALLRGLGASGQVYEYCVKYIQIVIFGCVFQIFASGLTPMLRNDHKTVQAMLLMVCGLITNIVLDAWFVLGLRLELAGAALATIIAQAVTGILCFILLFYKKGKQFYLADFKPDRHLIGRILRIGTSPFGLSLMPAVVIVINNWQCLRYGGDTAVAAYSIISYVVSSVQLLLQGVGEGIQPLISYHMGAREYDQMRLLRRKAVAVVLSGAVILAVAAIGMQKVIPAAFGASEQAGALTASGLVLAGIAFPAMGLVRLFSSYFYATGDARFSTALIYCDPVIVTPIMLLTLPPFFDVNGIWAAFPAANIVMLILLGGMYRIHLREIQELEAKCNGGKF